MYIYVNRSLFSVQRRKKAPNCRCPVSTDNNTKVTNITFPYAFLGS